MSEADIDISSGKTAEWISPGEAQFTDERCLLSFAFMLQVMEAVRDHTPIAQRRLVLAASCFDLAFEHHGAISRLCHLGHYGSANALIRPLLESVIAGIWFMYCCDERTALQLEKGHFATNRNAMLRQLKKKLGKRIQRLQDLLNSEPGKIFDAFTHGGMDQLRWRLPYAGLGNNHGHKQIVASLIIADIAMVNAVDAAALVYECDALRVIADKWVGQVIDEASTNFGMPAVVAEWQPFPPFPR